MLRMGAEKDFSSGLGVLGRYTICGSQRGSVVELQAGAYSLVCDMYHSSITLQRVWCIARV